MNNYLNKKSVTSGLYKYLKRNPIYYWYRTMCSNISVIICYFTEMNRVNQYQDIQPKIIALRNTECLNYFSWLFGLG